LAESGEVLCAELVGEVAVDDHHGLGVNVPGELRLALDVSHIAIPEVDGRGEAYRLPKS
jgi:hypothetical protein